MGLLWLESHFASVFGNESGWNDDEDLSIDCAEVWELYQAGEFCGLGLNDWTTKTGDDEAYFGRYLLFEDVFATFARFEDVGLLWLDSHFARVFGNESGWSDWPFECNIAEFWQQSQAVMVYIYLIRVDQTFQYGLLEAPCWIANEGNFALPSNFMDLDISLFDQEYPPNDERFGAPGSVTHNTRTHYLERNVSVCEGKRVRGVLRSQILELAYATSTAPLRGGIEIQIEK